MQWLAARNYFTPQLEYTLADDQLLSAFDVEHIEAAAMLWQTGYLTIKETLLDGDFMLYRLGLPNREVRAALNRSLLAAWLPHAGHITQTALPMRQALAQGDTHALRTHLESLFASIPHDWYRKNPIARYEGYFASVFYSHLAALGLHIQAEDVTSQGQIDITARLPGRIYLFEFKVVPDGPQGTALQQLRQKDYAAKYRGLGIPIHLVGVEMSRKKRAIVAFEVETEN